MWTISGPGLSSTSSSSSTSIVPCTIMGGITGPTLGDRLYRAARNLATGAVVTLGVNCGVVMPDPRPTARPVCCHAVRGVRFESVEHIDGDSLLGDALRRDMTRASTATTTHAAALHDLVLGVDAISST